jgi:hypothetical protein
MFGRKATPSSSSVVQKRSIIEQFGDDNNDIDTNSDDNGDDNARSNDEKEGKRALPTRPTTLSSTSSSTTINDTLASTYFPGVPVITRDNDPSRGGGGAVADGVQWKGSSLNSDIGLTLVESRHTHDRRI